MNFEVRRDDLRTTRIVDAKAPDLDDGQVSLRVSRFALTANNVTYAVFGDAMSYWRFFPTEEGWGRVPVWGFAEVEASRSAALREGERIYGYLPMATHLVVTPGRAAPGHFVDISPGRASLPGTYNQYQRIDNLSTHDAARERERAVLGPLFTTAFLIDDWLDEQQTFGATSILLGGASSKTALGVAFLLAASRRAEVIGLTSPANADFVRSVGYFDRVSTYDEIGNLPARPTAFIDMAGGGRILARVHHHFGDALVASCLVGATHWEESAPPARLPGPAPAFFFAPDRLQKRRADWGSGGFESRIDSTWRAFLASVDGWLVFDERRGPAAIADAWLEVVDARLPPRVGLLLYPRV